MASLVQLNFHPDRRTLRQFGMIAFAGFGLLALMAFREAGVFRIGLGAARVPVAGALAALAIASAAFSIVYPQANRLAYVGLSLVTYPIGLVVSYVIMGFLFFGVFGIIALGMRLRGRDPMGRARDPNARGYWSPHRGSAARDRYFRQF